VPLFLRASTQNALLLAWAGQLDKAHDEMGDIRRRCIERGEENELAFLAFHSALIEIWRGNFTEATQIAEDTMERAHQLGGDQPLFVALTIRATLAACAGRVEDARDDAAEALAAGLRSNSHTRLDWPITTLGFLEVSRGDYAAALNVLQPLLSRLDAAPDSAEIMVADFVPDAVEALIQLGRLAEAEPLIERLERNGRRLDRAWMLAIGARCRAMLLSASGDLNAATSNGHAPNSSSVRSNVANGARKPPQRRCAKHSPPSRRWESRCGPIGSAPSWHVASQCPVGPPSSPLLNGASPSWRPRV
jgi:hypothetical protein